VSIKLTSVLYGKVSKLKYDMCLGMKYFHTILLACSCATYLQLSYIINSRIISTNSVSIWCKS